MNRYHNVSIVTGNILEKMPSNGTIFYMYNPFNRQVMQRFNQILKPISKANRPILIYYNCMYLDVFVNDPFWRVCRLDAPVLIHKAAIITPEL